MKRNVVGPVALIASILMSVLAYPRLPASVPVHWNWRGEIDRYGSRLEAVLFGPILVAVVFALMAGLEAFRARKSPSRDEGDETGDRARETVESAAILLIAGLSGLFLAHGIGLLSEPRRSMSLAIAAFLVVSGNVIGQVRRNRFVGVRTPWTLASDSVWRKTHRLAARLMVLAGLALLAAAFFMAGQSLFAAMLVLVIGSTVTPAVYSFVLWRRERAGSS